MRTGIIILSLMIALTVASPMTVQAQPEKFHVISIGSENLAALIIDTQNRHIWVWHITKERKWAQLLYQGRIPTEGGTPGSRVWDARLPSDAPAWSKKEQ